MQRLRGSRRGTNEKEDIGRLFSKDAGKFFCFETEKMRSAEIFKMETRSKQHRKNTDVSDVTSTGKTQNSHIRGRWDPVVDPTVPHWEPSPRTFRQTTRLVSGWLFRLWLGCGRKLCLGEVWKKSNRSSLKSKKSKVDLKVEARPLGKFCFLEYDSDRMWWRAEWQNGNFLFVLATNFRQHGARPEIFGRKMGRFTLQLHQTSTFAVWGEGQNYQFWKVSSVYVLSF